AILDAAVRILVEDGTSALTHRRLAAAAGASVSSVIHFFETRRAILREAYSLLNARLRDRALLLLDEPEAGPGSLTVTELALRLAPVNQNAGRANEIELAGLLNAMFEASRDGETRQVALSLFARSGETSRILLGRLRGLENGASWLDAQLFRLTFNGLMMLSLDRQTSKEKSVGPARPDELAETLSILFGER
ncbi:MAG: TetR family transcriptional regulator, partial [Hyphomonas sp.]